MSNLPPPPNFNLNINRTPMTTTTPPPAVTRGAVKFAKPVSAQGHRICLYGAGGVGKTTLCTRLPGNTAWIDLDESLARLGFNDANVLPVGNWDDLRNGLASPGWDGIDNIVIDTATKAEEMATDWTIAHIPNEKGKMVTGIEGYGYGKGYQFVFDTFLLLLSDLDAHARAGRNVILVCHDCTTTVPNPAGDDFLRYEPRLQSPSSGKASIRLRVREWVDHLLYLASDIAVNKDGKACGGDSRTIYRSATPFCMAKSRTGDEAIIVDASFNWKDIIR